MKKLNFIKGIVFTGILGISSPLFAEESGWFAGAEFGGGGTELVYEYYNGNDNNQDLEGYRYGLLGGYKQFFTPKFGLRYYGAFDMGRYSFDPPFKANVDEYAFHLHIDALYNFITSDNSDFGVFGGIALGYVVYEYDMKDNALVPPFSYQEYVLDKEKRRQTVDTARDFDIRFSFGLRVNFAKRHGIEAFMQLPVLKQKETFGIRVPNDRINGDYDNAVLTLTNTLSSSLGVRYIFSF